MSNEHSKEIVALMNSLTEEKAARVKAENEVARLNKWADGFSDAQIKERQTGEIYQRELRAELEANRQLALLIERRIVDGISPNSFYSEREASLGNILTSINNILTSVIAKAGKVQAP